MRIKHLAPVVLFFILPLSACHRLTPAEAIHDLHDLAGNWASDQVRFFENWEVTSDTLMSGLGYSLQEQDTVFQEKMKIYYNHGEVFLAVKQEGEKDYTLFKLTDAGKNKWVFENKTNKYPNIITYEILDGELHATVMNSRGKRKIEFNMKRR